MFKEIKCLILLIFISFTFVYSAAFISTVLTEPTVADLEWACDKPFRSRIDYLFPTNPVICFLHERL